MEKKERYICAQFPLFVFTIPMMIISVFVMLLPLFFGDDGMALVVSCSVGLLPLVLFVWLSAESLYFVFADDEQIYIKGFRGAIRNIRFEDIEKVCFVKSGKGTFIEIHEKEPRKGIYKKTFFNSKCYIAFEYTLKRYYILKKLITNEAVKWIGFAEDNI